jgi:Ca2+-transporting ATPase
VEPPGWHTQPLDEVLSGLETKTAGLASSEAADRLTRHGPNRLPSPPEVSSIRILLDQFRSVVVLLLVAACVVSLVLGDALEAVAIAAVLAINTAIGFVTELRARRAIAAILRLEVPRATVLRDNVLRVIDAHDVVPGDIIELKAGNQAPADARLIESTDLRANEAALTGESLPSSKHWQATLPDDTPLAERRNMVYSSTTMTSGAGRAVVVGTGRATEVGRIGELTGSVEVGRTPLEHRLDALGRVLVWLALGVAALVAALAAIQRAPLDLIIETGIALAVAAVPEALPAVATIALAVGLHRMAARNALVRRLPAVESLGSTTVVCTDKTRTLTSGDMAVVRVWARGQDAAIDLGEPALLSAEALEVVRGALMASRVPAAMDGPGGAVDPVDRAVFDAGARLGLDRSQPAGDQPPAGWVPFSSERKFMAVFFRAGDGFIAHVKGAPGRVLDLCNLDHATRGTLRSVNDTLAGQGLRVLAVASGRVPEASESSIAGLAFGGFIGLADPPAAGVKDTIALLRSAGLRTVMLTGDQRLTAEAIGRELGLVENDIRGVEGRELDGLSKTQLEALAAHTGVFSRITPEHKLRIVDALQARGEIVAMLGDGVNDAPALRKADVGVAMGTRGTDVAKQAASIVLRDDRFETIAAAVEEGRVVFDNIRKFVLHLFSCNVAEVLVLLIAGVAGLPLPLWPLQLLWLNIVTDTFPALALALEPAESKVMRRPPRRPDEAILSRRFLLAILMYGALITVSTIGAFVWGLSNNPASATTIAFMTLALAQIFHLGNARRRSPVIRAADATSNLYAIAAVLLSAGLQIATLHVDPLPRLLRLTPLDRNEWLVVACCAVFPAVAGQALKVWRPTRSESDTGVQADIERTAGRRSAT